MTVIDALDWARIVSPMPTCPTLEAIARFFDIYAAVTPLMCHMGFFCFDWNG